MELFKLNEFIRGWFVGDFEPSLIKTQDVEVAVQSFQAGDIEDKHFHKVATEITVLVSGKAKMFDKIIEAGSIIKIDPGEITGFEAIEDCTTVVVKYPGAKNDKYEAN